MSAWRKVTPKVLQTGHLSHDIRADGRSVECCQLHVQSCMMFWDHMTVSMYELDWI
jgi:hypothetical protein